MSAQAMEAGAVAFLAKPFDDATFFKAVQRALARNQTRSNELR
jgi:FixJ family two-component response regulator